MAHKYLHVSPIALQSVFTSIVNILAADMIALSQFEVSHSIYHATENDSVSFDFVKVEKQIELTIVQ